MRGRWARAPFLLLAAGITVAAFSLTFTHLAGSFGGPGFEDGNGSFARFNADAGIAVDIAGNVYVADTSNHTIRKISPSGAVTTLAGLAETPQYADGRGAHALFNSPRGIAVDSAGTVYVADTGNHTIRKITSAGVASTFVGYPGIPGLVNATGGAARFSSPRGVTVDGSGNVYVADTGNHSIRMVTPGGVVTTLAGTGSAGNVNNTGTAASFNTPIGIAYDGVSTSLFVADSGNHVIRQVTLPGAVVTTFAGTMGTPGHGNGVPGFLYTPSGICADASGTLYVTDTQDHTIRSVTSGGSLGSLSGLPFYPGPADGTTTARFTSPAGIAVTGTTLYIADTGNHTVRKIALGGGNPVTTFAGTANASGFANASVGVGYFARFDNPSGLAYYPGPAGFVYVADTNNNAIRYVGMGGNVVTFAGGTFGFRDGSGTDAWFRNPRGLALRISDLAVYVADTGNHCIRLVDSGGNVSLFAGQAFSSGNANGDRLATASFKSPQAVAYSPNSGALYVADTGNFLVRKIDANGNVTTLAGSGSFGSTNANGTSASFGVITGIMVDSGENVYVAESVTYTIRKITSAADVTTLAGACCFGPVDGTGTAARFGYPGPTSISGDYSSGNAFVADPNANLMRTITLAGGVVGTAGGKANVNGTSDGTGTFARFNHASTISSSAGVMAIAEGNTIRLGGPEIADRATIDSTAGLVGNVRQLDATPVTGGASYSWSIIRRPSGSTATLSGATLRNPTFTPDVPDLFVFRCVVTATSGSSISTVTLQGNGPTTSFTVGYPGPETAGIAYPMQVTARDADGNVGDGYTGTVHFTSSDGTATLPANYAFTSGDHGVHFLNFTFRHSGFQSITTTDTVSSSITGTSFFFVNPAAASSLSLSMPSPVGSGNPVSITVTARDPYGNVATAYTGTIHFTSTDGTATLPSNYAFVPVDQGSHTFPLGVTLRSGGTQTVTATDTVTASITGFVSVTVGPPIPTSFTANGTTSQVFLAWNPSSGADHYDIWRASAATGTYVFLTSTSASFYPDNAVSVGAVYVYKIRAADSSANASPFSAPDPATTIVFTDDPLVAQTTLIKATHMDELRHAVNAIRACAGSGAMTVTDPTLTGGVFVKAIHIQELRTALNTTRVTLGLPSIVFTDPALTINTTMIRMLHVTEIRNGVK